MYQKITIADSSDGRARLLFQDRNSSAGISLTSPELLFFYTRYYSLYKLFNPQASQVLAIGGGAYTIPQAYINADPRFQVDVAEIEPDLYSLSQKYFRVTPSDRLTNILVDGRTFLSRTPKTYDIIFADAYFSFLSIPTHLTSQEFFRLVHRHLTPDGIFIGNFIGNLNSSVPSYFLSQLKTVKSVFPHTLVFASQPQNLPTVQNLIIVASRQPFANITPLPEIPALPQNQVDTSQFDLTPHTIYTDDYNPSEYVLAQTLKSYYYTR